MRRTSIALGLTTLVAAALTGCGGSTPLPVVPGPTTTAALSVPPSGTAAPQALDGTSFYFVRTDTAVLVVSVRGATVTLLRQIESPADDSCPGNSVVISPDGQWLAWVTGVRTLGDITGTLTVVRLDGSSPHTVDNVICSLNESDWTWSSVRPASRSDASTDFAIGGGPAIMKW